jgi:hypothetical protein
MHDGSSDGDGGPPADPSEPGAQGIAREGLSATDYLHLAEECLLAASLTKDAEKAAELVKASDEYLRLAAKLLADQLKND